MGIHPELKVSKSRAVVDSNLVRKHKCPGNPSKIGWTLLVQEPALPGAGFSVLQLGASFGLSKSCAHCTVGRFRAPG